MVANSPPQVDLNGSGAGTDTSLGYTENDAPTRIAPDATVADPDSPNFAGGTLTVQFTAGAGSNDRLQVVEGVFVISEQDILYRSSDDPETYVRIGSISGGVDPSTPLVITLTDQATPDLVQELTRSIAFANYSDSPVEGDRTIAFTLTDGDGGTSQTVSATLTLTAVDDPAVAVPDQLYTLENSATVGNLFDDHGNGPDSDPDGPITLTEVNGQTANVGQTVELASGALLTVNADGTYRYDPNHAFDYLVGGSGATNTQADDSFTYRLAGSEEVTVTVTVIGVSSPGDHLSGTVDDDAISGTEGNDVFDLSQGGEDSASGRGGDDYFYLGGAFSTGDMISGDTGFDVVALLGNYNLTLTPTSLAGIERLTLFSGTALGGTQHVSYQIVTNDANVARGETLDVLAAGLLSDETLTFNGLAERDGKFQVFGGAGNDSIAGGQLGDALVGNNGNDSLYGLGGDDYLLGGAGADNLRGGFGSDFFVYRSADESTLRSFDTIADFEQSRDKIDVHEIDANPEAAGDQAFTFIGSNAFSHNAGELRAYQLEGTSYAVEGDLNGDGTADFYVQVNMTGQTAALVASDFVL